MPMRELRLRLATMVTLAFLPALLAVIAGCAGSAPTPTPTNVPAPTPDPWDPFATNRRLGRGVNLGNALEAPSEGAWGVYLQEEYFTLIKEAGFDGVRVPIRWSAHAAKVAPYTIDAGFLARIDWVVDQALSHGLVVVVNMHHYDELFEQPAAHRERFLAIWAQIAAHYKDYPPDLLLEPLNEPHGALTAGVWNPLLRDALTAIRETNPVRNLVVGPVDWYGIGRLASLDLPAEDGHLIVTVHYYNPFQFTHQGAEWVSGADAWLGTEWQGKPYEQQAVTHDLDAAAAWGQKYSRPMYLGEFGAYSKADIDSRARWTAYVAREAEARNMSWSYWEFCAGFGVYDRALKRWNQPLLNALVPQEGQARRPTAGVSRVAPSPRGRGLG